MANTLRLHIGAARIPSWLNLGTLTNGSIAYVVEEGDQITLPNYNMVLQDGNILAGWCENENPLGTDVVFTKYYEPTAEKHDLYPVWVTTPQDIKVITISNKTEKRTTVTEFANLTGEERAAAQQAKNAFSNIVSAEVNNAVSEDIADIVRQEMGTGIEIMVSSMVTEQIGTLQDRVNNAISSIAVLDQRDTAIMGSIASLSTKYNNVISSINSLDQRDTAIMGSIASLSTKYNIVVGSIENVESRVGDIENDISDIAERVSTEAIEHTVALSISSSFPTLMQQITSTATFILGTMTVNCSVEISNDFKDIKTLADYKISTDYKDVFGTSNIMWYNNGTLLSDYSPINGGSVIVGTDNIQTEYKVAALPVFVYTDGEKITVGGHATQKNPATSSGITEIRATVGSSTLKLFNSDTMNYSPVTIIGTDITREGNTCTLMLSANPKYGFNFMGWCIIGTDYGENNGVFDTLISGKDYPFDPSSLVSKESNYYVKIDRDQNYGAVFEGDIDNAKFVYPILDYKDSHKEPNIGMPQACVASYKSLTSDINADIEDRNLLQGLTWTPIGNWCDYREQTVAENNMYLVILLGNNEIVCTYGGDAEDQQILPEEGGENPDYNYGFQKIDDGAVEDHFGDIFAALVEKKIFGESTNLSVKYFYDDSRKFSEATYKYISITRSL